jgi:hypothetical protein
LNIELCEYINFSRLEPSRQSDWDSIVTCHRGEKLVMSWNYQRSTMGAHKLVHGRFNDEKLYRHTTAQVSAFELAKLIIWLSPRKMYFPTVQSTANTQLSNFWTKQMNKL